MQNLLMVESYRRKLGRCVPTWQELPELVPVLCHFDDVQQLIKAAVQLSQCNHDKLNRSVALTLLTRTRTRGCSVQGLQVNRH